MKPTLLALGLLAVPLFGCGAGPQAIDTAAESKAEDRAKILRSTFDSVSGDYSKLGPDQKKKYLDQFSGDEATAQKIWNDMAHPPTGAPVGPSGG